MPVTINDVATHAGVSRQTVSRVINERSWVAPETRKRILMAVKKLGYRRNALASGLRSGQTRTIGMLVSNILNPFFASEVRAVQDLADAKHYQVLLGNTDENVRSEERLIRMFREQQIDGLIMIPCQRASRKVLTELMKDSIPVVLISRSLEGFDSVVFDFAEETSQAIQHLIDGGCRRIAMLTSPLRSPTVRVRARAYRQTLALNGLTYDSTLLCPAGFGVQDGYDATMGFLRRSEPPDAVFASSSYLTLGALLAIKDAGVRVPDDLAIVGGSAGLWARVVDPPLTMIETDPYALGRAAGELVFRRMSGDRSGMPVSIRLRSHLQARQSSRSPAASIVV